MDNSVKILISGDFAPTHRVKRSIEKDEYAVLFNDVKPDLDKSDYSITNLEVPLIDKGSPIQKTGPNLKAPTKSIKALKYAGFDMVTLANNHIMDYGPEGLKSTIELCERFGISHIGAGKNNAEAKAIKYVEIKTKKFAFINLAENEWSTTPDNAPGANPLNEIDAYHQIKEASMSADYTIVLIHGGHETYGLPSPRMKKLYRWFIDLGADAVIGHHTHCFSGDEVYKGKPIVYSLGNFIFDTTAQTVATWNTAVIARLIFQGEKVDLELTPYHQCNDKIGILKMSLTEQMEFKKERSFKTTLIQDDELLEKEFDRFVYNKFRLYASYLEPIKNKYVLALMNRNLIPRIVKGKYRLLLHNLVRAEAHRDIIIKILKGSPIMGGGKAMINQKST